MKMNYSAKIGEISKVQKNYWMLGIGCHIWKKIVTTFS